MNRVFVVCLLLVQAVYGTKNFSLTIGTGKESPAGVTYVEGKAPEDLKAGPVRNATENKPQERIVHAAIIQSSARDIPKDDEVENEEFERFIKEHLNRPSIETVFVSSKPAPVKDVEKETEELDEEPRSQAEFFKHPTEPETFQRSVALPTIVPTIDSQSHDLPINIAVPTGYPGGDGVTLQSDGGQYSGGYFYSAPNGGQFFHYGTPLPTVVPVQTLIPQTSNVGQHGFKTKTFEIRRPAIQKHYYDIEERVIIRPAGSIIVELDRPVAKIPTGESIVPYNGGQGGFAGFGIQQSQGGIGISQGGGGLSGFGVQQSQGGIGIAQAGPQGGLAGVGFQQDQSGIGIAQGGPQGGLAGFGVQQTQGGLGVGQSGPQGGYAGAGGQQSQGGIGIALGGPQGGLSGVGFQQNQAGVGIGQGGQQGGSAGVGGQQSQGGIGIAYGGPQGGLAGVGVQQSQGGVGIGQGGQQGGQQGGYAGIGGQQSQGGIGIALGGPQGGLSGVGFQQNQGGVGIGQGGQQGGSAGVGGQQSQGGIGIALGGPQGGLAGVGIQQTQGGIGGAQGGPQGGYSGTGIQQSQGGIGIAQAGPQGGYAGFGVQQSQGGIGIAQGGGQSGVGIQQSPGGVSYSTTISSPSSSVGIGASQGGVVGIGVQSPGGVSFSTTISTPASSFSIGGTQGGVSGIGVQQSQGGIAISTTPGPTVNIGGPQSGVGFQQSQGSVGIAQNGPQGGSVGIGVQQTQGGIGVTTVGPQGSGAGVGIQQSQGGIGIAQSGPQGSGFGFGIQQSQGGVGVTQGGTTGIGIQQGQGGVYYSTTSNPFYTSVTPSMPISIGVPQGGFIITSSYPTPSSPSPTPTIILRPRRPSYPLISTTPGSIIATTPNPGYDRDESVVVEARSNVQNSGSFSSTTTTERSFSVSADASAYARGSSSGNGQGGNKHITPFMITVGEPNFSYPPYVEIRSNGLPLGHLHQYPYHQTAALVQPYPRMRYQGRLLTGEVQQSNDDSKSEEGYGALSKTYQESPAHVSQIPPTNNYEEQPVHHQSQGTSSNHYEHQQYGGSSQQPLQPAQTAGSSHQQPAQVYQHHFLRATSQPITVHEVPQEQDHSAPVTHRPVQVAQQHYVHRRPNLVTQLLHQQQQQRRQHENAQVRESAPQQHVSKVTPHPVEVKEISSSTHRNPSTLYEQQLLSSTLQPEPVITGSRLYHQHPVPLKYTQHHSLNVAPFGNHPQQSTDHGQKQNLETPPVVVDSREEASQRETSTLSTTLVPQHQRETYASVLAKKNQPDITYSSPSHVVHHPQQSLRFSSEGSPLFSPNGHQLHFAYSQPSHAAYSQHALLAPSKVVVKSGAPVDVHQSQQSRPEHRQAHFSVSVNKDSPHTAAASFTSGKYQTSPNSGEVSQRQVQHPAYLHNSVPEHQSVQNQAHFQFQNPQLSERQVQHPGHSNIFVGTHESSQSGTQGTHEPAYFQRQDQHSAYSHSFVPDSQSTHSPVISGEFRPQNPAVLQRQVQHPAHSNHYVESPQSGSQLTHSQSPAHSPIFYQRQIQHPAHSATSLPTNEPFHSRSQSTHHAVSSSTTPASVSSTSARYEQPVVKGSHKYRNEQTHGAITLRSGSTYGEQRVIASTPAPRDGSIASESVQTRRIVVNHPFQTVQEVVEQEPITKIHQLTINQPATAPPSAQVSTTFASATAAALTSAPPSDGLQKVQSNTPNRPAAYKLAVNYNHPGAALSYHHHG